MRNPRSLLGTLALLIAALTITLPLAIVLAGPLPAHASGIALDNEQQGTASTSGTNHTISVTAAPNGDVLTLLLSFGYGSNAPAGTVITDNQNNTWHTAGDHYFNKMHVVHAYAYVPTAPTSITVTNTQNTQADWVVAAWSGLGTNPLADLASGAGDDNTTVRTDPAQTTQPTGVLLASDDSITSGLTLSSRAGGFTAWTQINDSSTGNSNTSDYAYEIITAAGSYSYNVTLSATTWHAELLTLIYPAPAVTNTIYTGQATVTTNVPGTPYANVASDPTSSPCPATPTPTPPPTASPTPTPAIGPVCGSVLTSDPQELGRLQDTIVIIGCIVVALLAATVWVQFRA